MNALPKAQVVAIEPIAPITESEPLIKDLHDFMDK